MHGAFSTLCEGRDRNSKMRNAARTQRVRTAFSGLMCFSSTSRC